MKIRNARALMVACDGGTTSTRAGLYADDRTCLAEAAAPPCNPVEYGVMHCIATLQTLVRQLTNEPIALLAAGISGARKPALRNQIALAMCDEHIAAMAMITDDLHPVLYANAPCSAAILVAAGTGSSVLAQDADGRSVIVGGRGRLFGDDGSAYQVAVSALRAAAQAVDRLGPDTLLAERLPAAAGLGSFADLPAWSATATKERVAALAMIVDALAREGDPVARECLAVQAERLARQTHAAAALLALPANAPVFFHGGMFEHSALFLDAYQTALASLNPKAKPVYPPLRSHRAVLELALNPANAPEWLSVYAVETPGREPVDSHDDFPPPRTEQRASHPLPIDRLSSEEIVRLMNAEEDSVSAAIERQTPAIAAAIDAAAHALAVGGRIIYIGAGTSGRLGVLDAAECPPTFGVSPERVIGIIAGGERALRDSVEGAEDDMQRAIRDLDALTPPLSDKDFALGISASGRTPYVLAAITHATAKNAPTGLLACNPVHTCPARILIGLDTGPEVVAGSTRLKAGTATKRVLNMISTGAMALSGHVCEGFMVGMRPINDKLRRRAARIVAALTGLDEPKSQQVLIEADWDIRCAVVMARRRVDLEAAKAFLEAAGGVLRDAMQND